MRVAIIHPWFPKYREALFEQIVERAALKGIVVDIYTGEVPPEWTARGDVSDDPVASKLPTKFFRLRGRNLSFKSLKGVSPRNYDFIVVEQAVRNLETYVLLMRRSRLAFWGHGRTYTENTSNLQESFKHWITRRGHWFFAYTPGGARDVAGRGFPTENISVVMNSIDTKKLVDLVRVADSDVLDLNYDPSQHYVILYVGGLDVAKRIEFLLQSVQLAHKRNPNIRLLVAGDGDLRSSVEAFGTENLWMTYLGRIDGERKAAALSVARALAIPGRVGLVAVDALALQIPVITTNWPFHAPEFEYLVPGENAIVTEDSVEAYSDAIVELASGSGDVLHPTDASRKLGSELTIERAAQNFVDGLVQMGAKSRGRK